MDKNPETNKVLKCRSCGAALEEGTVRCPYCNGVDLFMAEVSFMDRMYDMSDELNALADEDYTGRVSMNIPASYDEHGCEECRYVMEVTNGRNIGSSHADNMDAFSGVYADARKGLDKKVRSHGRLAGNIAVIALLAVIIAAFIFIHLNRFEVYERYITRQNTRSFDAHVSEIESLIDEGDFFKLYSYCDQHDIDGRYDGFDAYRTVIAQSYFYFRFTDIMLSHVFYEGRNDSIMISNTEILVNYLHEFYENGDPDSSYMAYRNELIDREKSALAHSKMEKEIHGMLMHYCGFTEEELGTLSELTETEMLNLFFEKHSLEDD